MQYDAYKPSDIFKCRQCGDCCKGYGGAVVNDEEIVNISRYINSDPERFVSDYCLPAGKKLILAQGSNGYCIFWNGLCMIHPVKPGMCRSWPFIKSVLTDTGNWQIMASMCPGMRTDVPSSVVKECVAGELAK